MLRYLGLGLLALVVAGGGYYFYQVNRIESGLDDLASRASAFGRVEYDGVSLRPGGRIRIHDVRFHPRGLNESLSIGRIVLRGESLIQMLNLQKELQAGQFPRQMGISVQGVVLPVDGQLFEQLTQQSGFSSGLMFDAAGCGDRTEFDARDLTGMDYWDLIADVDASYELSRDNRRVTVNFTAGLREMARNRLEAELAIAGGGRDLQSLVGAEIELETARLVYEDQGFYERMVDYCADRTDLSPADYRTHHLEAWESAWSTLDMDPGEETVSAYAAFVESPGEMTLSIDPVGDVDPTHLTGLSPYRIAERLGLRVAVNGEDFGAVALSRASSSEDDDEEEDGGNTADTTLPWQSPESGGTETEDDDESTADDSNASPAESDYERVSPSALPRLAGRWVVLHMNNGDEKAGRIVEVESGRVRLEQRLSGGYAVVPVNRAEIREVRVVR